jgi:hypothetical protein
MQKLCIKRTIFPLLTLNAFFLFDNSIDIPLYRTVQNDILQVLYVGRGAPQKEFIYLHK